MDQLGDSEQLQICDRKLYKLRFIKRSLQFAVSLSLLSLFFFCCSLSKFNNVYFSTFLLSFFTQTMERKYMFLLCNGILAFIAKSSTSSTSFSSSWESELNEVKALTLDREVAPDKSTTASFLEKVALGAVLELQDPKQERNEVPELEEEREVKDGSPSQAEDGQEEEGERMVLLEEDNECMGEITNEVLMQQQEEEVACDEERALETPIEEGASEDAASVEELNRRFEEFIRRMKEELRIEAQQHLIAV